MLLHDGEKTRKKSGIGYDQRFAAQKPAFRAADVERVTQRGKIGKRNIVFWAGQRIGKPCPVQIQGHPEAPADPGNVLQLRQGIQRSELGRVRNIYHPRHNDMLAVLIPRPFVAKRPDRLCRQLAVFVGQCEDLMPAVLDGAGFVNADMTGIGGDHTLIRAQERVDHRRVRLRAADKEIDRRPGTRAGGTDLFSRGVGQRVEAVAGGLDEIRFRQAFKNLRVSALHIIRGEHCPTSLRICHFLTSRGSEYRHYTRFHRASQAIWRTPFFLHESRRKNNFLRRRNAQGFASDLPHS